MDRRDRDYIGSIERIIRGEKIAFDDFLHHFEMQNGVPEAAPAVGASFPDFRLPDQDGALRDLASVSGRGGVLLVFVRSVNWCGYCRNQLAELDLAAPELRRKGIGIVAIAPEPPGTVRTFHRFAALGYTILADEGAVFTEAAGLLNTRIPRQEKNQNGGRVPYPCHYLLDPGGVILDRHFADDIRHRPSGTELVFRKFGPSRSSPGIHIDADETSADIVLSTGTVHTGMAIGIRLSLVVKDGWHVYAPPQPGGYRPLSLTFDNDLVGRLDLPLPPGEDHDFEALGERVPVYSGRLEVTGRLHLNWSPPVHGSRHINGLQDTLAAMQTAPGDRVLRGRLAFQACSESGCGMPQEIGFDLPVTINPDIDKAMAVFADETDGSTQGAADAASPHNAAALAGHATKKP